MKSKDSNNSEEKIKKVTEFLTKLFRFCFFLIIAPFAISFAGFWILIQFPWASYIAFTISVLIFMFSFLFFYKSFDKYRNNPFFYNKSNNPIARVHIIFLISLFSYIITPIFVIITPKEYSFIFLPLICFSLLYNIVYYYYYFQPIDFFNIGEGEFKHAISLKLMVKQPYNIVIVINYFIQVFYLSLLTPSDFTWLFGLINNGIFYLITFMSVSNQQKEIKKSIKENRPFLKILTIFKRKFVLSLASFIFILLIQMPFISLIQRGQFSISILIDTAFLSFLFLLLFLKIVLYIYLHYEFLFELYKEPGISQNPTKENKETKMKYQKLSSILTAVLILFISLYAFFIELPYIPLLILPFFFLFTHYEHKSNYSFKKYNNFIILLYCLACLASISFGIFSFFNFNIQIIIFSISFYFLLELFGRVNYFKKGNILITQNILAMIAFFLIILNYVLITPDPFLTLVSNIFLILTLFFVVLLFSFYRLYTIFFKEKYSKTFKICVLINLFLIELMIFTLINYNTYARVSFNLFIKILTISTILFPLIFVLFVSLNYLMGMINLKTLLASIYYSFWSLIVIIFLSILITFFPNYIMMIFNFFLLLVFINFNLKYGVKIEKIQKETYEKAMNVLSYPIFMLLLALIFSIFYSSFQFLTLIDNLIISSFLTLIITCFVINCISAFHILFTKATSLHVNILTLLLSSIYLFYYLLLLSLDLGTFYLFTFPVIITTSYLYIPLLYILKKNVRPKATRTALVYNGIFLSIFLTLVPTFIYLELLKLGLSVNIITLFNTINFTLYILFGIFLIYRFKVKENIKRILLLLAVLIAIVLTGTTVFFYFFLIFYETQFRFLLPLMIASVYFFIPGIYAYRKEILKISLVKKCLTSNTLLLSGMILCVPTLFGLQMEKIGLRVDYLLIVIFTVFLLFVILKIFESIATNLKLKERYILIFRLLQIYVWLILSLFISYEIILVSLAQSVLIIKFLIINCSILTFFILNIYTLKLLQLYSKRITLLRHLKDFLYYGLIFSPSLVIVSLIMLSEVLKYLPTGMRPFSLYWYLGFFFLIGFLLFRITNVFLKVEYPKLKRNIEFTSWIIAKATICFFISFILTYYLSLVQFSVFNLIITFILIIALLSPITFSYFEKFELVSEEYRYFIKRFTLVLLIIDILSFISYSWLFNNPIYGPFNLILTATFTLSLTGSAYVLLFYKSRLPLRRISFFIVLPCIVISFPIFLYFFISLSFSIPFGDPLPLIIAIDIGIFLFYLSIGLYQWKISWAIWRTGWFAWFLVPFTNFYLLYRSLKGVDIATRAIDFFGYEINGSFLLTTVIFLLSFLPIAYTKIKVYFYQILLIIWGINLALLYWISQNLFLTNFLLRYLVFALFAAVLLAPLFYKLKFWKTISLVWLILIAINANFLIFFLLSLNIPLDIAISIDIFAIGMLVLIFSFFPVFKSIKNLVIIGSYLTAIIGIFLTIYFIFFHIILDPIFSLNITFIFVGFSLFTSKFIKPIKRLIDQISSWILIFGISWLIFNSLNLIPNLLFLALFLAIAGWGGSFYVFNYYKMKIRIPKIFPFTAVAFGVSSAISSFLVLLLPQNPFFIAAIFISSSLFFLYISLENYRLYLWYLFPLPFALFFQELFLMIDYIQSSLFLAVLLLLIDYLVLFQLIMNCSNNYYEETKIKGENTLSYFFKDKNQIKLQNLICFIINSIYFSILISVLSLNVYRKLIFRELIIIYQILNVLIILPFLLLFCIKYIIKSELELKVKNILTYFHKISYFLYIIIPLATSFNLFLLLLKLDVNLSSLQNILNTLFLCLITLSGMLFIELFLFDNHYFYYLFVATRNKLMFLSWVVFCNTSCIFIYYFFDLNEYFFILSISLVNLIDSYFISYFNFKSENFVSIFRLILFYNSFIWVSFYISSLISDGLVIIFEELKGIPSFSLFIQNLILFLFIFSFLIRKIKKKMRISITLLLIALFQIILAINWVMILFLFQIFNLFTVHLIILIETCLSFITAKFLDILLIKEKFPNFLTRFNSLFIFLIYLETSIMIYGLAIEFLGFFESLLLSQLALFALTSLDIYLLNKIKASYSRLVHTISYFILSLAILLILNQFVKINPLLLSIEILVFLIMQFYTNHSLFLSLSHFYPDKTDTYKRHKLKVHHSLGILLYGSVLIILIQSLSLLKIEISLLLLITSLFLHGLMILDVYQLKLLGKLSIYLKGISWLLFIFFSNYYLIWVYVSYLFDLLISVIPPLILLLVIELFYLIKLFEFIPKLSTKKEGIRQKLLIVLYLDFIIWPLLFLGLNIIFNITLFLISFYVLVIISYIDEKISHIFKDVFLKKLRFAITLIILLLIIVDIFSWLHFSFNLSLPLNICISLLIFSIFSINLIKPYKKSHNFSFVFGSFISLLISLIIFFATSQTITSIILFPIMLTFYLFIFMLEVLKAFFNKLLDFLTHLFDRLKKFITYIAIKCYNFLKLHYKIIWISFSLFLTIAIGFLLSPLQLNYLNWYHSIFVMLGLFGLLTLVLPSKKTEDVDLIFKHRMRKLITSWITVIAILFLFISPIWYIIAFWISIWILGIILIPYVIYKERRDKISVKWRFYTLIIIFTAIIIVGIPAILSFLMEFNII